ncbi:MAG: hypothetical protein BGO12_04445 [Verrucomicrobia bacterium 61-8]|nr:MAG: hypothetical protein BGO12_04445 [Verrucomicrobia bacterium 61-8]
MTTAIAHLTDVSGEETWESFYEEALQFFESEPSPVIYGKLQGLFERGVINSAFLEIFRHLLEMDIQYQTEEWAGTAFRSLFRPGSSNPLHQFIPDSFRRFAAKPGIIRACLSDYLDHHEEVLQTDLRRLCRDIEADRRDFERALKWAQSGEQSVLTALIFTINRNEKAPRCPNWTISEWLTDNQQELLTEHQWRLEEIFHNGREELRVGGARVDQKSRDKFALPPASDDELAHNDECHDFLSAELEWVMNARQKLNATHKEAAL